MVPRYLYSLSLLLSGLLFFSVACGGNANNAPKATEPAVAPPDPAVATPQSVPAEAPLGAIPDIPSVLIVSSR